MVWVAVRDARQIIRVGIANGSEVVRFLLYLRQIGLLGFDPAAEGGYLQLVEHLMRRGWWLGKSVRKRSTAARSESTVSPNSALLTDAYSSPLRARHGAAKRGR